ncbi:hypothecal protein [Qipengyuania citrea LAMA 915]|uniref:Hypothecal protein n=1 Tax=Qipengyuania citrea LAMA 915 TaxID=1306953 RepID=A0A0L1KEY5_9SPHN|nr:contractile injection system protein, VgrG/Pvc8 family [Qipengyuania citrea]KNH02630.1 hypothecal protein [Qipengyuania citrea LAMA 915]
MTALKAGIELKLEDGADLAAKINPRLVGLRLTEKREGEADEFELTLQNADGLLAVPDAGRVLTLALGWLSGDSVPLGLVDKGRFTIAEVGMEGPPDVVTIKGQSADLTGLLRQRRTKAWKNTTLGAILQEIATRHGRTAQVDAGLAALAISAIEQEGKSDMALVADLGRRYDAIATWKDGRLIFLPIGKSATAGGIALPGASLEKRDGWRWSFTQADREKYDGASAQWQDQAAGRRRTVGTGGDNPRKLKRVYASEPEARQAAEAAKARAERAPFSFSYDLAIADPALQPDMRVSLSGWGAKVDGIAWLIKSVATNFGSGGLRQSIEMESA